MNLLLPKANKDLGQHFLIDQMVVNSITNDYKRLPSCEAIIEVGPGPAILTTGLSQVGLPLYLVEKDERFKEQLLTIVPEERLILTDALALDWTRLESFLPEHTAKGFTCYWLVSNLPYNVGTPLIRAFLEQPQITAMTLMMQKEVAEKVIPPERQKNSANSLMCLLQSYFQVLKLREVPPGAFRPPPKVDSMVLSFIRREQPLVPYQHLVAFEKFLRLTYGQKRKQLIGLLKARYQVADIKAFFLQAGLSEQLRAETLTLEQVISLFKHLHQL